MSTVCFAVIIIVLVTMFMFARSHNRDYAFAIWPLVIVPAAHLLGGLLSSAFRAQLSRQGWLLVCIILDLAALLAFILVLFFRSGRNISGGRSRRLFFALTIGFILIFTALLVLDLAAQISDIYLASPDAAMADTANAAGTAALFAHFGISF